VGTTTTDIPASAIQEFQISQSSLDMSSELTSSGSVNVTTKSGTNSVHGEAFGTFRDSAFSSQLPTPVGFKSPYQRSQYGGDLGGPSHQGQVVLLSRTVSVRFSKPKSRCPSRLLLASTQVLSPIPFMRLTCWAGLDYALTKSARIFGRFLVLQE
jgi:hypothetical protein